MHLANQELWEATHAIPGFTKLDKLSQSSMGGNPKYKGSPQASQRREQRESAKELEITTRDEGNTRSKEQLDSRQPTLQEATTQA